MLAEMLVGSKMLAVSTYCALSGGSFVCHVLMQSRPDARQAFRAALPHLKPPVAPNCKMPSRNATSLGH